MPYLQRYFIPRAGWENDHVTITSEDVHHITRVMRMNVDNHIICCTPDGQAAECIITHISDDVVHAKVESWLKENKELPVNVTLVQGLPKGDKMELVIQKGTELGAYAFVPFEAQRSIVKWDLKKAKKKIERYQKIAKEASEQSHRTVIPKIYPMHNIHEILATSHSFDVKIIANEDEAKTNRFRSLGDLVRPIQPGQQVLVVIGPEGGFSEEEIERFKEFDFISVRFGPRILRTETASLYLLAALSYQLEELG